MIRWCKSYCIQASKIQMKWLFVYQKKHDLQWVPVLIVWGRNISNLRWWVYIWCEKTEPMFSYLRYSYPLNRYIVSDSTKIQMIAEEEAKLKPLFSRNDRRLIVDTGSIELSCLFERQSKLHGWLKCTGSLRESETVDKILLLFKSSPPL